MLLPLKLFLIFIYYEFKYSVTTNYQSEITELVCKFYCAHNSVKKKYECLTNSINISTFSDNGLMEAGRMKHRILNEF